MTPVTAATASLAAAALTVGLLGHAPAAADPVSDPVSALLGALTGSSGDPAPAHRERADYGRTSAPDGTLRRGCRNYPYRYRVSPPTNDWTLETFLSDRTGEGVASGVFIADSDPARARSRFRFCRYSTMPGRFKIRAKLIWYGDDGSHTVWLPPSYFRLRRPA